MNNLTHLFITDPFDQLIRGHDSTLAMIQAALAVGDRCFQATPSNLSWCASDGLVVLAEGVERNLDGGLYISGTVQSFCLSKSNCGDLLIWMRKDPPVDDQYIRTCQLLRLSKAPVLNNPSSLLACDEKLLALQFAELMPRTLISSVIQEIKSFITEQNIAVLKPIGGKAGEGILVVEAGDKSLTSIIELLTERGRRRIIAQEYLPIAQEGDKRIFLLAGDPIGAVLRVPSPTDHRANMAAGGKAQQADVTSQERKLIASIKPALVDLGLWIVGLDVIGGMLTEINITSPTCLIEIDHYDHSDPAGRIISWSKRFRAEFLS